MLFSLFLILIELAAIKKTVLRMVFENHKALIHCTSAAHHQTSHKRRSPRNSGRFKNQIIFESDKLIHLIKDEKIIYT